jgi:hypothetical protein
MPGRGQFVFCPGPADRSYKNFVTVFAARLAAGPGAPRLSAGRCRQHARRPAPNRTVSSNDHNHKRSPRQFCRHDTGSSVGDPWG